MIATFITVLTWRDSKRQIEGPAHWALANALVLFSFALLAFHENPGVDVVRSVLFYTSIIVNLVGFARFYGLGQSWPLVPMVAMATVLSCLSSLVFVDQPQLRFVTDHLFYFIMAVGGGTHLVVLKRKGESLPLGNMLVTLFLLTGLGLARLVLAVVWIGQGDWLTGQGPLIFANLWIVIFTGLAFFQLRLVNQRLRAQIVTLDRELTVSQREMLTTLADVIENNSHETSGHVTRVGRYLFLVARGLGISEPEAQLLAEAAHLHDIGKIGIPERILEKAGALTPEEFEVMKTHTALGHDILCRSERPLFKLAARIAWEHHENWDGTGYPRGLAGTQISLEGRIVALCDVIDALSHRRSYKEPWSRERILEFIRDQRGRKFDPELVDIVLANPGRFQAPERTQPEGQTA